MKSTSIMSPEHQGGFAIVSAIFILVVLAALGGFIATVSTTQHMGSALDVMGAQAYQAARAGAEWGLCRAVASDPSCVPITCPVQPVPASSTDIGTVNGMAVTVTCTRPVVVEAGPPTFMYAITATACNLPSGTTCPGSVGNPNYVERKLNLMVEK